MVMNVVVVAAIGRTRRARRCRSSPGYGAQPATDRRTDAGTMPAARDRADDSPGAGADQTSSQSALTRIIWVCMGRCRQQQSGADQARDGRTLSHWLPLARFLLEGEQNGASYSSTAQCSGRGAPPPSRCRHQRGWRAKSAGLLTGVKAANSPRSVGRFERGCGYRYRYELTPKSCPTRAGRLKQQSAGQSEQLQAKERHDIADDDQARLGDRADAEAGARSRSRPHSPPPATQK
jgi:hypothetical protein